jgi:DNA-binding NarL/FixJ family response regulator
VLVAGEAGVGKTRLVAEFTSRAIDAGVSVLTGGCVALIEGELAYAPLVEAPPAEPAPTPSSVEQLGLTARELEVLRHLAAGRSNREIGQALFITPKTASVHISNILRKLQVTSRVQAATAAHRLGLVDEDHLSG